MFIQYQTLVSAAVTLLLTPMPVLSHAMITPAPIPGGKYYALEKRRGGKGGSGGGGGGAAGGNNYYGAYYDDYAKIACGFVPQAEASSLFNASVATNPVTADLPLPCTFACGYSSRYVGCFYTLSVNPTSTKTSGFYKACYNWDQFSAAKFTTQSDTLVCTSGSQTQCQELHVTLSADIFTSYRCFQASATAAVDLIGGSYAAHPPTITGNVTIDNLFWQAGDTYHEDDSNFVSNVASGFFGFVAKVGGWAGFGAIIGSVVLVIIIAIVACVCWRKRSRRRYMRAPKH